MGDSSGSPAPGSVGPCRFGLPSTPNGDAAYRDNDYWRGRVWGPGGALLRAWRGGGTRDGFCGAAGCSVGGAGGTLEVYSGADGGVGRAWRADGAGGLRGVWQVPLVGELYGMCMSGGELLVAADDQRHMLHVLACAPEAAGLPVAVGVPVGAPHSTFAYT